MRGCVPTRAAQPAYAPTMATVFVPDVAGWQHAFKARGGLVGKCIADITDDVANAVQVAAPGPGKIPFNRTGRWYGTGRTQGSIRDRLDADGIGEVEGIVYTTSPNAKYILFGTRPHTIRPKKPGGRLVFFWWRRGRVVHLKVVHHPGTLKNDFMNRGLRIGFKL